MNGAQAHPTFITASGGTEQGVKLFPVRTGKRSERAVRKRTLRFCYYTAGEYSE